MESAAARAARARERLDRILAPIPVSPLATIPAQGWIRSLREALEMPQSRLAARLGVNQKSVHAMEAAESAGHIRLDTLRRAADALDCDVVYALVPRRPLAEAVADRARQIAREQLAAVDQSMLLEDQLTRYSAAQVEVLAGQLLDRGVPLWRDPAS
jgi:predicted DNA-binding mobile mystery protein A